MLSMGASTVAAAADDPAACLPALAADLADLFSA
jgi:hypothetical protein